MVCSIDEAMDFKKKFMVYCFSVEYSAGSRNMVLATSGDLYVRSVRSEDSLVKYSCLVTNTLNGDRQRSDEVMLQVIGIMLYIYC